MKKLRFFAVILIILSLIWCVFNIINSFEKSDWVVTTAEITFIALPEGKVIGKFSDVNNIVHKDVSMYQDYRFTVLRAFKKGINPEPYIGTKVKIIYNPYTNQIISYDKFKKSCIFSVISLIISFLLLWICIHKKRTA